MLHAVKGQEDQLYEKLKGTSGQELVYKVNIKRANFVILWFCYAFQMYHSKYSMKICKK